MKTITIRELHEQTGRWVRQASAGEVYVTERGRPIAKITPVAPLPQKPFFQSAVYTGLPSAPQLASRRNRFDRSY